MPENKEKTFESDRILSYFQIEWRGLLAVTISGLIYNLGLIAGPWFEGKMTGCLVDILKGTKQSGVMLYLVTAYVAVIAVVQISRYIKRFYVRRFANNVNRRMKQILYRSLVLKSRASLREEEFHRLVRRSHASCKDTAGHYPASAYHVWRDKSDD